MVQEQGQIIQHIADERRQLDDQLSALETNLRRASDWKFYVGRYPLWALGAAAGTGMLVAGITSIKPRSGVGPEMKRQAGALGSRIDTLFGTAMAFASDRLTDVVLDAFPGLRPRYQKAA